MSNPYWNPYPHERPNWTPPSQNSELPLEYRFEQMKLLGRIEAKVDNVQDRLEVTEAKLDRHIETCQQPRKKIVSFDALKDNWTLVLLGAQVVVFFLLQMLGQPDKAQQVWGSSASFQQKSGEE